MDHRTKKLLFDVVTSGRSILEWCRDRTFGDYEQDRQLRRAVEREFEVIGEALSRLVSTDRPTADRITHVKRTISFRKRISHGYDAIDNATVWGIVQSQSAANCSSACSVPEAASSMSEPSGVILVSRDG